MAKISRMNDLKNKLSRSGKIIFNGNETGKILIKDRKLNIILEMQDNELLKDLRNYFMILITKLLTNRLLEYINKILKVDFLKEKCYTIKVNKKWRK